MPDLPLEIANWLIAGLLLVATYFLKDLRESFRETKATTTANREQIALLKQEREFQHEINSGMLMKMADLGRLIEKLHEDIGDLRGVCAATHGRLGKLEAGK